MQKGRGQGQGSGQGAGQGSGGRGHQPRGQGRGPGGHCVCPSCGYKGEHKRGTPCYEMECPECGTTMVRDD